MGAEGEGVRLSRHVFDWRSWYWIPPVCVNVCVNVLCVCVCARVCVCVCVCVCENGHICLNIRLILFLSFSLSVACTLPFSPSSCVNGCMYMCTFFLSLSLMCMNTSIHPCVYIIRLHASSCIFVHVCCTHTHTHSFVKIQTEMHAFRYSPFRALAAG